ncbi:DUF1570 domain-containing protein [Isosphaeraceae bacterium EP7]
MASTFWLIAALATSLAEIPPQDILPPPEAVDAAAGALRQERRAIHDRETSRLLTVAGRLENEGKSDEAQAVRGLIRPLGKGSDATRFVPCVDIVPAGSATRPNPGGEEIAAVLSEAADALFALAGKSAAGVEPNLALADACLRDVLERRPDHAEARRLMGYIAYNGGWATPYAVARLKEGMVPHATFGWVLGDWVPHLERGELPALPVKNQATRWLPASQADAQRQEWSSAWKINTEHFQIQTNAPLADAIAFGRKLEALDDLFFALMADVIGPELPLAKRFRSKGFATAGPGRTHLVYYYANQNEYIDALLPRQGESIRESLGIYMPREPKRKIPGASYFYRDPKAQIDTTATLFHEASHQLLFETAGKSDYSDKANYWVIEGMGCYFETLKFQSDGTLRIGGMVGPRLAIARKRAIDHGEFMPTERLVALGRNAFNGINGGDVYLNYAQAMALTTFLMQREGAHGRDAFLDYVRDVYKGRTRAKIGRSLQDRLQVSYETLDAELLDYLKGEETAAPILDGARDESGDPARRGR